MIREPCAEVVVLYSDAEGNGGLGADMVDADMSVLFLRGRVPRKFVRCLEQRATQIVAYELFAALVAVASLCPNQLRGRRVIHYIDSSAALARILARA